MKNRAKMISLLMAVCMMLTLLPAVAFAADPYGDFTITGSDLSGVSFAGGVLTISKGGTYTIKNDNPENYTNNRIVVDATDGTVALVFNGINIKGSNASALTIQAPTSISMEGSSNKLAVGSGDDCAAITNTSTTPVEIGGAGSMSVEGTMRGVGISGDLRLIGGSLTVFCSNGGTGITGNVTVSGGSHTAYGGNRGNGIIGNVTVSGGSLTAYSSNSGTGIIGNATVSGGSLTAYSGNSGNGITGNATVSGGSLTAYSKNTGNGISGTLDISGGMAEVSGNGGSIGGITNIDYSSGFNPQIRTGVRKSWGAKVNTTFTSGGTITDRYVYIGPALCLISFDENAEYSEGIMDPLYIKHGETVELTPNAFTRDEYTFNGWNTKADGTGTAYADKATIQPTDDMTLYAQWKSNSAPTTYTVTFDANGGSGTMEAVRGVSGHYILPANGFTAPDGKQFKGWKVGNMEYAEFDPIDVTSDITVIAVWKNDDSNPTPGEPGVPSTPSHSHSHDIDVWYIAGNSFGTSKSAVPTGVEIDGVPVSFTGDGREFIVSCIPAGARRVTVRWGSTSVSTNFTPDVNSYCTQVSLPKTGDASVMAYALMAVMAAAGAMGKK